MAKVKKKIIKIDPDSPDEKKINEAAEILKNGGVVAFPTETVYGLGANLKNKDAIDRLYKIKSRSKDKPFTVHISNLDTVSALGCSITHMTGVLIKKFWPGPLTIVMKGKDENIGFRMPNNKIAARLISKSGVPVIAPSANISGKKPATSSEEVIKEFSGKVDAIIDGGETSSQKESTVIDSTCFPFRVLREGALPKSSLPEAWDFAAEE